MIILALIVAAIAAEAILVVLVVRTLWLQGDVAERRASDPQLSQAQDYGAVAPTPTPSAAVPFAKRGDVWARSPGRIGARYVGGRA